MSTQSTRSTLSQHGDPSPVSPEWRLYAFDELGRAQLYAVLAARGDVFVVEQDCPYQDLDGLDNIGLHLVAWDRGRDRDWAVAAYARILPPGTRFEQPSIGRVLTCLSVRRTGIGRELMRRAIAATRKHYPGQSIRLSAQCYLETFYDELGFSVVSAPYEEDGIPHVEMELPAEAAGS